MPEKKINLKAFDTVIITILHLAVWAKWNSLDFTQRFALSSLLLFLLAMPVAVYLTLTQTNLFPKAGLGPCPISGPCEEEIPATLSFSPDVVNTTVGGEFTLDVVLDTGSHEVAAAQVVIQPLDTETIDILEISTENSFLPTVLEKPTVGPEDGFAGIFIRFVNGSQAEQPVTGKGKIASIRFKALKEGVFTPQIRGGGVNNWSKVSAINTDQDVLGDTFPAQITVTKESVVQENLILNLKFENAAKDSTQSAKVPVTVRFEPTSTGSNQTSSETSVDAINNGNGTHTARMTTPVGSFNVFAKGTAHLRRFVGTMGLASDTIITAPKDGGVLAQTAGDIVDNNTIDIFDYAVMVQDFGPRMPEAGSPADLDLDGDVDIFDYSLIVQNFGLSGE